MSDSLSSSEFAKDLKNATTPLHVKLESLPISQSIVSPQLSIQEYLHYLDLMHDIVVAVEEFVFPKVGSEVSSLDQRRKRRLFEEDFKALNYKKDKGGRIEGLSEEVNSTGFAMGILYVIEGSSLGGRVILKNIQKNLNLEPDSGAAYFAGYGERTGMLWKDFMEILVNHKHTNKNGDEIIAGANHAFNVIISHFQDNPENR